ncbi:MAG: L,D-transpeptidase family protein [Pseudomonadales bacterium]|nr:L,D-transpeptidase family protein [Pseudomonadales bacterium]
MSGSVLRHCVIPVIVVLLGAGSAVADIAAPPDSVDGAYGVLERLGLLQQAGTEPGAVPAPASTPAPAAASASAPQESAGSYAVLERLGLLQKPEPVAPAAGSAPAGTASPETARSPAAPATTSAEPAPTVAAPAPTVATPAAAPVRSRFAAGAVGMLERLGMVYRQQPSVTASEPATTPAAAPASVPASAAGLAETAVRTDAVAGDSALMTRVATPAAESPSYQVLRRLGLLKPAPGTPQVPLADARSRVDRVVVEKSKRKLYLMRNGEKFREYPILLGAMPRGPKVQAGDLRTPEGVYTLDWRNPNSRFYKAIHISYPSPSDRERAQEKGVDPGGMVMIHGEHYEPAMRRVLRRKPKDWTEGCIALNNEHIDELWHTVPVGTPIEIKP